MSHPINDMIADDAIDTVAAMSDTKVLASLIDRGILVDKPTSFRKWFYGRSSDDLRDILTDMVCDDLMSRPGPHG
tara:strand:- start:267 stop:491 length:225 start_codon:yes stop_codon:yes gene_type:complete